MSIDEIITDATDAIVLVFFDSDHEVANQAILRLVTFSNESKDCARFHTRLDLNFFLNAFFCFGLPVALCDCFAECKRLGCTIVEFKESAATLYLKIWSMCVTTSSDRIFMQVRCDALDHLHLFASFIKCDGMRIAGTEENLEDLKWVTIEGIA